MAKNHVVITGTGRTGTTFLVQLLTNLGLETGFTPQELTSKKYHDTARAGLEHDLRLKGAPYVVKSPWFCDHAKEVLKREDIAIDHVFIPMRDLQAAAESRRHVVRSSVSKLSLRERLAFAVKPYHIAGGLWHTSSSKPGKQEDLLLAQIYKVVLALSETAIPITFIHFPRLVQDGRYLFEKLRPILGRIGYEEFLAAFQQSVQPKLVHSFTKEDR